jgi:hypothetical protein
MEFDAGEAWRFLDERPRSHVWVLISEPGEDAERLLWVNFTSWEDGKDPACICEPGEHASLTKRSCIMYRFPRVYTLAELRRLREDGRMAPEGRVSADLLFRIRLGAWESELIDFEWLDLLEEQGLGRDDLLER